MSLIIIAVLLAAPSGAVAPSHDEVIGDVRTHVIRASESLIELARQYGLGFNELAAANARLDPWIPRVGAVAVIPTAWIVPRLPAANTVVVNLSEMRLYLRPPGGGAPITFPVGVAVAPRATPLGVHTIVEKAVEPTWYPTEAILREDPTLPAAVPPGPENPLGTHALRLSARGILIHGTNRPFGVGRKVSHGCLRLYPEDISRLYALVDVGTQVAIVREPVKVGMRRDRIYVEIHDDETLQIDLFAAALRLLGDARLVHRVDPRKLSDAVRARSGVPTDVTGEGRS